MLRYFRTGERPDLRFWLLDDNGALLDLSSGYTFTFKLGNPGVTATFTKTTGLTGAAGSGAEPNGVPNLTVTFTSGELDNVPVGPTAWQIRATTSSLDRYWQGQFMLHDVIL